MTFSFRAPALATELQRSISGLPIVSPHGHIPVGLLSDASLGDPANLFVTNDHYVLRMLYSQGVALEALGVGQPASSGTTPRAIWRVFSENFTLFRGTPSRWWILDTLAEIFDVHEHPSGENADALYDTLTEQLQQADAAPLSLLKRQRVELICTTDDAGADLSAHHQLQNHLQVLPTFRPDAAFAIDEPGWRAEIERLESTTGIAISDVQSFLESLRLRRAQFVAAGAVASDHAITRPAVERLASSEVARFLAAGFAGTASAEQAAAFTGHMLFEMAEMSRHDGLVLQLHAGAHRNHNQALAQRFGAAIGGDIPVAVDWTNGLQQFLNEYGTDQTMRIVLFTLDESTYSRELAPLAGHYPALRLGPPWWFHDSPQGIRRYLDSVVEVAGFSNLAGFNDDARNLATLGSRHRLWRKSVCGWLADQVAAGLLGENESLEIARDLAYSRALDTYRLILPGRSTGS